ncbi:MAG: metal-sensing transcriptional repressor [Chitinophagaceae bacterium]|nr:metal-sensing transcriptional repressor [Chitinophagaceae bacterium]
MLPNDLTKDLKTRLKGIRGQIEGVIKMLDESNDPAQILNQFKAASKGFEKAQHLLLDEVFRKALAIKIVEALDTCPGDCGQEEKIAIIRTQFPELGLNELTGKMKEMNDIMEFLHKDKEDLKEVLFKIDNISCLGCSEKITDILTETVGVKEVKIAMKQKLVKIKFNPTVTNEQQLKIVMSNIGYSPRNISRFV